MLAATITFEPTAEMVARVLGSLNAISRPAVCFDNSVSPSGRSDVKAACEAEGAEYMGLGRNVGTGAALNRLLMLAVERGHGWVLYLDQDSVVAPGFRESLASCVAQVSSDNMIGAIGSVIELAPGHEVARGTQKGLVSATYTIASGTLFNVAVARRIGGFDEDLFLDTVDHEFCLRLRALNYKILQDRSRSIVHQIGADGRAVLGMSLSKHPLWRRKLMWRNSVIIMRRYWREHPRAVAKHLIARVADTVLTSIIYRDPRVVAVGIAGALAGCGRNAGEIAAKYKHIGRNEGRSRP